MENTENKNIQTSDAQENSDMFSAAAQQDKAAVGTLVHKFSKPFTFENKTYEELTFDFDALTGRDYAAIENELRVTGHAVLVAAFDGDFLIRMCAKACTAKIGVDTLMAMPFRDYNKIRNAARGFLTR